MSALRSLPGRLRATASLSLAIAVALPGASTTATVPPRPAAAPAGELPATLAGTGLYADFATKTLAPGVLAYTPQYPLWTDGATKRRWIRLPDGAAIDASDPNRWVFPTGTRLWKEFALERRIETRYLELGADGMWLRGAYLWSADGSEAPLAPERGVRGAAESEPGVPYDVPARADCAICHAGREVLGFELLQLSPDRDPLAPHADPPRPGDVDLPALAEAGLLRGLNDDWLVRPPHVAASGARERAVLGYLHANCGVCHTSGGLLAPLELELDLDRGTGAGRALATTVGRPSRFRPPGAPAEGLRIAPGRPELSALLARLSSRDPAAQMPPIGTHRADAEAAALIAAWIREDLPPSPTE